MITTCLGVVKKPARQQRFQGRGLLSFLACRSRRWFGFGFLLKRHGFVAKQEFGSRIPLCLRRVASCIDEMTWNGQASNRGKGNYFLHNAARSFSSLSLYFCSSESTEPTLGRQCIPLHILWVEICQWNVCERVPLQDWTQYKIRAEVFDNHVWELQLEPKQGPGH